SIYFSVCLCALFAAWFMRDFLELALHAPQLDRILQSLQLISVALLPMVFLVDNFTLTYIATLLMAVVGACALSAGIICTRMESRTGKYFLLAWSTLILGIFLSCLRYLGLAPESSLTQYFVHVGVLAEVLLLSFALADRINRMRQEKAAFQEQANALLHETNLKLEKSMLLQRNFLTAASHELRTPMNGIMGATDLLSDCDSEEERNQYINDIYRSSRKMMSLVENILDFTDVESGDFRPINKAFTLSELLEPLIIQFKGKAHRKGLNFSFELDPADPQLLCRVYEADPRIIQKAMSQLLSNALKFTSRGEISVITRINKNILYPEKTKLAIEIKDTGIGMKPETLKDMFIAFQQGDGTFKRQYEGLGIGLSLAKSLMDKVEGTLSAKSSAGQGSSFTLSLKIRDTGNTREAANEELPQALITRPKPVPARNKQILLVEDNPVNLKVLNKMVEKQGYSTLIAENGMQAVQLLQDYKVDLVLMDCQMPVMDGFEATREIRQMHNGNQHVPIVAVTANTLSEDEAQCYDAGMNGFVPKPINQKVIQSLLLKWLNQPYLAVDQTQAKKVDYLPAKHS
ncbi:MAG: response regulator, partial [Ketobacteraceae bacterium]|nr:response regulator [Ketobacteraceae bacterium]